MRLLLAVISIALTPVAHATQLDDFVLTGGGHTYTFSFPSTGIVSGEPNFGITSRVRYTQTSDSATVDGVTVGSASGQFVLEPGNFGTVTLGIDTQDNVFFNPFYGPVLVGYNPSSLSGYVSGPYQAFFFTGSFDLFTRSGPTGTVTPYTLTITPEASTTPEPATLTFLATGTLGLLSTLRRRLS